MSRVFHPPVAAAPIPRYHPANTGGNMRSVALIGPQGSGKSTLAQALGRYGYRRASFAAPLKMMAGLAYGCPEFGDYMAYWATRKDDLFSVTRGGQKVKITGRQLLQELGTDAIRRHLDEDFWIKAALGMMQPGQPYAVDDCRFPNEYEALKAEGFVFVRVAGRESAVQACNHESEHYWPGFAHEIVVDNRGSVSESVEALISYLSRWDAYLATQAPAPESRS